MIEIRVDDEKAKKALAKAASLEGAISSLLALVAMGFQQEVEKNLNEQGALYGKWAPASKWIIAKEGRSKLFPEAAEYVRVRSTAQRATVVFASPKEWTLSQHQAGFTRPPTGTLVTLDLKQPSALGIDKSKISFISKRPSRVPARRMWPTDEKAKKTATPLVESWAKKTAEDIVR